MAFQSVMKSMLNVGYEEEEVVAVVSLLAGVILIGDIVSSEESSEYTLHKPSTKCYIWGIIYAVIEVNLRPQQLETPRQTNGVYVTVCYCTLSRDNST